MTLGAMLRRLRKSQRLTLVNVSEQTDLSVSFLSDIERGKANPSPESLKKLATVYHVEFEKLSQKLEQGRGSTENIYPPGFTEFLQKIEGIDEEMQQLLLQIENRSARRPQTDQDWIQLYYSVKTILGQ